MSKLAMAAALLGGFVMTGLAQAGHDCATCGGHHVQKGVAQKAAPVYTQKAPVVSQKGVYQKSYGYAAPVHHCGPGCGHYQAYAPVVVQRGVCCDSCGHRHYGLFAGWKARRCCAHAGCYDPCHVGYAPVVYGKGYAPAQKVYAPAQKTYAPAQKGVAQKGVVQKGW